MPLTGHINIFPLKLTGSALHSETTAGGFREFYHAFIPVTLGHLHFLTLFNFLGTPDLKAEHREEGR